MERKEKKRNISCIYYVPDEAVRWTDKGYVIHDEERVEQEYNHLVAVLDNLRVKLALSPLHFADTYDEEAVDKWVKSHTPKGGEMSDEDKARCPKVGDIKKPHWHIFHYSGGGRTLVGMRKLMAPLGIMAYWVEDDKETAIRYQAHLDNPSKASYDPNKVRPFGGLDVSCLWKKNAQDKISDIGIVCSYIQQEQCVNFYDLVNKMLELEDPELFETVVSRNSFFGQYMAGLAAKMHDEKKKREAV